MGRLQELLRRNAELISQVEAKEQDDLHTESSQGTALMLQEINNNLVEVSALTAQTPFCRCTGK